MLLSLISSLCKLTLLCWHLSPLPFLKSDLQVPFYTCECNRTVQDVKQHPQQSGGGARQNSVLEGRHQTSFFPRKRQFQNFISELSLFSFKVFLAAEEADQERETWMTKTSQYCQVSACFSVLSGKRNADFTAQKIINHFGKWKLGWGYWERKRGTVHTLQYQVSEDRAVQMDQHKACATAQGGAHNFMKPVYLLESQIRPSIPLWYTGLVMAVCAGQVVSARAANYFDSTHCLWE